MRDAGFGMRDADARFEESLLGFVEIDVGFAEVGCKEAKGAGALIEIEGDPKPSFGNDGFPLIEFIILRNTAQ